MEEYWLWLCSQSEIASKKMEKLLRVFGTPEELYRAKRGELEKLRFLKEWEMDRLLQKEENPSEVYHRQREREINFISREEKSFPKRLLSIADKPFGLFFKGRLPGEEKKSAAVIGARACTYAGQALAGQIGEELALADVEVISGMARGIDGCAQEAALRAGGESYAILGSGVDVIYPPEHQGLYESLCQIGGVISEFPPGSAPLAKHFPRRNRLISALADFVIVVEARERSGSLITVDCALEQGKEIYAVPGRPSDALSRGCNRLIAQGAGIFSSTEQVLEEQGIACKNIKKKEKKQIRLATKENLVYSCLDLRPKSLQRILDETKLPMDETIEILLKLQMREVIFEVTKNYYQRVL
ncbi:MAG: DNA-processing protein DprA [Robinsoniella sp.]|nr:DNA-processing protein DprA [Robinsoniella sp.]